MKRTHRLVPGLIALLALTTSAPAAQNKRGQGKDEGWIKAFKVDPRELETVGENPFFILKPGYELVLEEKGANPVRLVITVLDETKNVGGIETRVVVERESRGGIPIEVSRNYYAIHPRTKDVYYLGEEVDIYKHGKVSGHEGAWAHGTNGAAFGLMMPGAPVQGLRHFQELAPDVAMDRAEVVSVHERVATRAGTFSDCLKTKETTPLEIFSTSYKLYAPGVGLVRDGDFELVSYGMRGAPNGGPRSQETR